MGFAIGVGGTYNEQNLKDMASEPHSEHVYKLDNFDVADFKKKLLTTICTEASSGSSNNSGSSSGKRYVNTYQVNYNCDDGATPQANHAVTKTRTVRVEDTTNPTVTPKGHQGEVVNSAGFHTHDENHGFEGMSGKSNTHDS